MPPSLAENSDRQVVRVCPSFTKTINSKQKQRHKQSHWEKTRTNPNLRKRTRTNTSKTSKNHETQTKTSAFSWRKNSDRQVVRVCPSSTERDYMKPKRKYRCFCWWKTRTSILSEFVRVLLRQSISNLNRDKQPLIGRKLGHSRTNSDMRLCLF